MKELAVIERYIFGRLEPIASGYGWTVPQVAPFDLQDGTRGISTHKLPILFYRMANTRDRPAMGPGPRTLTWADYEIGVFHDKNTFGGTFEKTPSGTVSLKDVLQEIDDIFQNYDPPIINTGLGGTVYSVQRLTTVRLPERIGGKLFRRDGGIYQFLVEADQ